MSPLEEVPIVWINIEKFIFFLPLEPGYNSLPNFAKETL